MFPTMATPEKPARKAKAKPVDAEPEPPDSWGLFARIDPSIQDRIKKFTAAQKFPPRLGQVVEQALRDFLDREGF